MVIITIGTVIQATHRPEDLIPAFGNILTQVDQNNEYTDLLAECVGYKDETDGEQAGEIVEALFEALNNFAPPYCYFGAHPGDGSDFGYWPIEEIEDEFEGLKVNDLTEVPDDYLGDVLLIDAICSGNQTFYHKCAYELHEVWSIV